MTKDIKKALEEASAVEDKAIVDNELSPRQKIIAARKKQLQRQSRQKTPKSLR
tara:strand:+ start:69 stop:227 length:159 start_codon:yes stop_codon:yes gene_type:complete